MSVHEPPQFTPGQILEAGQRAETEGRIDFAQQFYRHLVDHYPGTPEAGAAQQRLARLFPQQPAMTNGGWPPPPQQPERQQVGQPHFQAPPAQPFGMPRGGEPAFPPWPPQPPMPSTALLPRIAQRTVSLPLPVRDYRAGRTLARIMTWLGVAQVLVGIGLIPVAILSPRSLSAMPLLGTLAGGPVAGAGIMLAGLVQIVLGQLIRAVLDQANAARDLAAVARAQAEGQSDQTNRPSRR